MTKRYLMFVRLTAEDLELMATYIPRLESVEELSPLVKAEDADLVEAFTNRGDDIFGFLEFDGDEDARQWLEYGVFSEYNVWFVSVDANPSDSDDEDPNPDGPRAA